MYKYFGPFPQSYHDIEDDTSGPVVNFITSQGPPEKPFHKVGPREIPRADVEFLSKIMKLDPHERPTAEQLLADVWLTEESEDTRAPLAEEKVSRAQGTFLVSGVHVGDGGAESEHPLPKCDKQYKHPCFTE